MSKIISLIEAIRSFNLSDCVKCLGEVQKDWLLTEDLNVWAGREVLTADELAEWVDYKHTFSDFHKEAHGTRPRWSVDHMTLSDWKEEYERLERICHENAIIEREREEFDIVEFKKAIAKVAKSGAGDFSTALRWMMQADGIDPRGGHFQEIESFFYDHGILFTDYGQKLLKVAPRILRGG